MGGAGEVSRFSPSGSAALLVARERGAGFVAGLEAALGAGFLASALTVGFLGSALVSPLMTAAALEVRRGGMANNSIHERPIGSL